MSNERRFDLNDLITEEDIASVERAAIKSKEWEESVGWHRKNDPNFEEWYVEECRKIREESDAVTVHYTKEEIFEKYRKHERLRKG